MAVLGGATLHDWKTQNHFFGFFQNSSAALVRIHWRNFLGLGNSLRSRSHSGVSEVCPDSCAWNGPLRHGAAFFSRDAFLCSGKLLEIQETALVAASSYKTRTDPELVSLCLNGDALAWETLMVRYRRLIYSIPTRFGFRSADSADVFQVVCLKLIEHLHEVKDESKLSGWLSTTTSRYCLHLLTLRQRESASADDIEEPPDPAKNLEEIRIETEEQQAIRDCVDELPERCRSLIDMLYFDMRSPSYQEISQSTGMPVASIGPNRARCLEKLKKILQRRGIT